MYRTSVIACAAIAASTGLASAAVTGTATDEATFQSFLASSQTEDFNGLSPGDLPYNTPVNLGLLTGQSNGTSSFDGDFALVDDLGNIELAMFIDNGGNIPSFTITFPSPVDAFGARYEAVNGPPALAVEVDGETVDIASLINADGYVGITSNTTFTSVTFIDTSTGGLEFFRMDDVTFGIRIPTPASAALLGLGGLAATRRRR